LGVIVSLSPVLDFEQAPDSDKFRHFADQADRFGFDLLLLGYGGFPLDFEPLTVASALAGVTRRIGLGALITTALGEPFTLARGLAALDHLSRGRAAWQVAVRAPEPAVAYAHRAPLSCAEQDARAMEFVEVAFALWNSWGADWLTFDIARAELSNADKVHPIDHEGRFFRVRGPLNTPRPRQGRPVIVLTDDVDEVWAARTADVIVLRGSERELHASAERYRGLASGMDRELRLLVEATLETAVSQMDWAAHHRLDGVHIIAPVGDLSALTPLARDGATGSLREQLGLSM
jgi:alkanesulfonate monooxygenase SsuD/methylene tetrahydromethanopterin reductase-like flavin-dependent oxidoreductase (luciferase family)